MTDATLEQAIEQWQQTAAAVDDKTPLETALELVEQAARFLERGELPLETSMQIYEQSIRLTTTLQSRLEEARQKIEQLLPDGSTVPFGESNE